jgi:hypothetical protein
LLISHVISVDEDPELRLTCGLVKVLVKGRFGCLLLPGLTQIAAKGSIETLCKQEKGTAMTGTCVETKELCEELQKEPLLVEAGGGGFINAAMEWHLEGSFNFDVFIDD